MRKSPISASGFLKKFPDQQLSVCLSTMALMGGQCALNATTHSPNPNHFRGVPCALFEMVFCQ